MSLMIKSFLDGIIAQELVKKNHGKLSSFYLTLNKKSINIMASS